MLQSYRGSLDNWYRHYAGYDPLFTWWAKQPFEEADQARDDYLSALRTQVVGWPEGGEEPIVGDPVGADGMAADLEREMIPYTPEELIAIANREFAWCEAHAGGVARPGVRGRLEGGAGALLGEAPGPDFRVGWRFYGDPM